MSDIQTQFVKNILSGAETNRKETGLAFAPSNIALCKYWGKRHAALNLPLNSSLSISLGSLGTRTELRLRDGAAAAPAVFLNGELLPPDSSFAKRVAAFLDLFPMVGTSFEVRTENNIPTAAGLASSASGFAALTMALNDLAGWGLGGRMLSMLARLGSGSASRSVFDGFVQWHMGSNDDGSDSFAEPFSKPWPEFRIGILELTDAEKPVGSRDGMNRTVETSALYANWPAQANADFQTLHSAILKRDFPTVGQTAEHNALSMHATMMSAWPPLIYLQPESVAMIHQVQRVRADGLDVYLTIDAGPNIKLLFLEENEGAVASAFPNIQVINPFG
ncbi:diphosphomevalonate decarboxylase [Pontiella sp.]|uniref:diphosphomevalonate decarboxylase n=1 Tax=Pontiella sp. TaxID=2837462 RepID=UPI0035631AA9